MTDPPWGDKPPESAKEFFGFFWRTGRAAAFKKKQVVDAVRADCQGKSRNERRVLFERELDRYEVPCDPIWVERELDELELLASERPFKRAKDIALAATTLRRVVGGFPDPPTWMALPEDVGRAVWEPHREKTAIDILPGANNWLKRALTETPRRIGKEIAFFDVWFDWEPGMDTHKPIAVYLGAHKVGVLDPRATHGLLSSLEETPFAQPKPYTNAALARAQHLQPPYLLVVEVPVSDSEAAG
jgi:hypothetical protein